MIVEVNAVEQSGRIDDMDQGDLGIWGDSHIEPLARFVKFCREQGTAMAIQIGHADRKAYGGEKGRGAVPAIAPSAIPFDEGWETPHALTLDEIPGVIQSFRDGARRAIQAGFQAIEIHGAHGYLLSSFLSPLANHRSDAYSGDINARARLACEVTEAVHWASALLTAWSPSAWRGCSTISAWPASPAARAPATPTSTRWSGSTSSSAAISFGLSPAFPTRSATPPSAITIAGMAAATRPACRARASRLPVVSAPWSTPSTR